MTRLFFLPLLLIPSWAWAHVKWFSDYSFEQPPLQMSDLNHPSFWGLLALSVVSLPLLVWLDKKAESSPTYHKVNGFLDQYANDAPVIMRVAIFAVLLMSWQGDTIVAPDIIAPSPLWGWFEFALALLLLFRQTTPLAGIGMLVLYVVAITNHGMFHMLDYVVYAAAGLYLILNGAKNIRIKGLSLPVLYSGLGFSLCWVAFEKIFYPYWGLQVLESAPALTMGLDPEFFLLACAFIEFTLGYLLIICLLHRPLALIITLVFFTTTAFFGKTEVVGHTLLHGALLVFLVQGPGDYYQAPIRFHKKWGMRMLFASTNFIILFALMAFPYSNLATQVHHASMAKREASKHVMYEIPVSMKAPTVRIISQMDPVGGWNLQVVTQNFTFTPEKALEPDVPGEGHAHLYINGKKIGRVYGEWIHVNLPQGKNTVRVTLNTNSHKEFSHGGVPVQDEVIIVEEREVGTGNHQH